MASKMGDTSWALSMKCSWNGSRSSFSAGLLVGSDVTVTAGLLVGSDMTVTAGLLVGSDVTVTAGLLVGSTPASASLPLMLDTPPRIHTRPMTAPMMIDFFLVNFVLDHFSWARRGHRPGGFCDWPTHVRLVRIVPFGSTLVIAQVLQFGTGEIARPTSRGCLTPADRFEGLAGMRQRRSPPRWNGRSRAVMPVGPSVVRAARSGRPWTPVG